jgi:uncharacterized coiled-coil protein SlyX
LGVCVAAWAQDTGQGQQAPADSAKPSDKASSKPSPGPENNAAQLEAQLAKCQSELAQLNKTVAELKQQLTVLSQGLSAVDKSVDELKKDLAGVNAVLQQQMLAKRLDEVQKEIAQLRDTIRQETERLQAAIGSASKTEVRKAFSPPLATGQIILRNDWSLPVSVTVDGTTYTLQPGQEQRVIRAAGTFTYEVHGWQPPRTRTLSAGEQFLIRIAFP